MFYKIKGNILWLDAGKTRVNTKGPLRARNLISECEGLLSHDWVIAGHRQKE